MEITDILSRFNLPQGKIEYTPYGNGHINDTFLITITKKTGAPRYILQRMNHNVFPEPEKLMHNISKVTSYLQKESDAVQLQIITTKDGTPFLKDGQDYWRMYNFIENAISLEMPENTTDCYEAAFAFGDFQRKLSNFPAQELYEILPNFHNTPNRFYLLQQAVQENIVGRLNDVQPELDFAMQRRDFYNLFENRHANGRLPLRVTHNDTKLNNVLLNAKTRKPLCVIDLDTVMPGYAVNDFGDMVRFGTNTAAEDEPDLSKVHFSPEAYKAFVEGFMAGCNGSLTADEIELLPHAAKMMTMECGIRFLTDYLQGDTYFKTAYPEHNLVRCRTQFKLVEEMEQHWEEMCAAALK